jgi:hypothetical protein
MKETQRQKDGGKFGGDQCPVIEIHVLVSYYLLSIIVIIRTGHSIIGMYVNL